MRALLLPGLLVASHLSACVRPEELWVTGGEPLPPETRSIILAASRAGSSFELFALPTPFELTIERDPDLRLLAIAFDRDLPALDLVPGRLGSIPGSGGRRIPPPLAIFMAESGRPFARTLADPNIELPPHDWPAILGSKRCGEGLSYVGSTCGSTVSFEVRPPAPPVFTELGQCPAGWEKKRHEVDRGPGPGPQSLELCEPPPRLSCGPGLTQAAGDQGCRSIGDPCLGAESFPRGYADTSTVVFVLAGAPRGGDGSRARPYATLGEASTEAALRGARAVVLGRGRYREGLRLEGTIDVAGACAGETILEGTLALAAHHGRVSGLSVIASSTTALEVRNGSRSVLDGVLITATSSQSDASRVVDSELEVRGSAIELPSAGRWVVSGARLSMVDTSYRGQLRAELSQLSVHGSAIIGSGGSLTASSSTVSVDQSYLAIPLSGHNGRMEVRRSWLVGASTTEREHQRSIYAQGGALVVSQVTIEQRRIILPVPPAYPGQAQIGIELHTAPAQISDVLVLMPEPAQGSTERGSIGLSVSEPVVQPHRFERLIVEGGGWAGLAINKTQAELVDVGIHRGHSGILGDGASIEAERLLITQSILDGVNLRLASTAVLRDVGVYESVSTGLVFKGEGPYRGTRVKVATERRSATGINLEEAFNNPVSVFLRELEVQGPFAGSIQVGNGTGLEVTHFRIDGANLGVELLGVNGRRSLKKGTIRTESTGLDVANDLADLAPLLDGVRVEAPRPIKRTKP